MTDPTDDQGGAVPPPASAGADEPRTEPGSDLPGTVPDDLRQVADEVDAAMAEAAREVGGPASGSAGATGAGDQGSGAAPAEAGADPLAEALAVSEQRLGDLQRERAEFVNYRRRVERDREVAGLEGRTSVLTALLPVLDDIDGARNHGDLVGPFAAVADKLDAVLRRVGLEPFGEVGDAFDPALHEALLHDGATEVDEPTCTQVLQRGYRSGDRVLRPARVAVASPQ